MKLSSIPVFLFPIALCLVAATSPLAAGVDRPALRIQTLDGRMFDLAAERGRWVIVNFWATWCSPCIKEMPALSAFVSSHANVTAIGLDYEETGRAEVEAFLKKHPVSYPVAQVDTAKPPVDFATPRGLPTTYLIAPDGHVAKRFIGPVTADDLETVIGARTPPAGT
ncbi:MAG TPA: TlpA disulfide reductase family protein [Rhodanobacteraceae bacterium]|nr:TlpA disulfide reductase family protein [Rhodanobacteraceae bacterium]